MSCWIVNKGPSWVLVALADTGPLGSLWAVIFLTAGLVLGCAIIRSDHVCY